MRYIKNWGYKIKYSSKRLLKNIRGIVKSLLSLFGIMLAVAEICHHFGGSDCLYDLYHNKWYVFLIAALCISLWKNWDRLKITVAIKDSPDVSITLKVCDALLNEGAVIIPTNSTFDTTMKDDFISPSGIQGQYQLKYFKKNLAELDQAIKEGLKEVDYTVLRDGRRTNTKKYPIGTVAKISGESIRKRAYFLADSNINANGIPQDVTASDINISLEGLWASLNSIGNKEPFSIPLLGTGRAGVKDASRDEVIKQIIVSFIAASKEHKITEELIICIHPMDFEKVHWDLLCEYLKYQCQFVNIRPSEHGKNGKPEKTPHEISLQTEKKVISAEEKTITNTQSSLINEEIKKKIIELLREKELTMYEISKAIELPIGRTKIYMSRLYKEGLIIYMRPTNKYKLRDPLEK